MPPPAPSSRGRRPRSPSTGRSGPKPCRRRTGDRRLDSGSRERTGEPLGATVDVVAAPLPGLPPALAAGTRDRVAAPPRSPGSGRCPIGASGAQVFDLAAIARVWLVVVVGLSGHARALRAGHPARARGRPARRARPAVAAALIVLNSERPRRPVPRHPAAPAFHLRPFRLFFAAAMVGLRSNGSTCCGGIVRAGPLSVLQDEPKAARPSGLHAARTLPQAGRRVPPGPASSPVEEIGPSSPGAIPHPADMGAVGHPRCIAAGPRRSGLPPRRHRPGAAGRPCRPSRPVPARPAIGRAVAMAVRAGSADPATARVDWRDKYAVARPVADRYASPTEPDPLAIPPVPQGGPA